VTNFGKKPFQEGLSDLVTENSKLSCRKKIKVANVIMEGRFAGPQARIIVVAEKLQKYNIETIVVFPKNDSALFYERLTEKGIQVNPLSLHRLTKQKSHLMKFIASFIPELFSLYRLFKKENVDIVHCNGSWQFKGIVAGKLAGAKVVWHLNDTNMLACINIIFRFLALHFCEAFITAGKRVNAYYLSGQKFAEKQIVEIQAPVDTSIFAPNKVKEDPKIAQWHGLKIITVGNINPFKGIEYFIEMASILSRQYNNLNFFVIGPRFESQRCYLEKIFRTARNLGVKNLHFYGRSDDVSSVLKAADIYVCSSIAEASPISVWEAMAMAKPIVSTDVGDVSKFITDGECGFVVPPRDGAALAEKVSVLVENKDLRDKFGKSARAKAVKELDAEICANKHRIFYLQILERR